MRFFHAFFMATVLAVTSPTIAEVTKAEFSKTYKAYAKALAEGDSKAAEELSKTAYEQGREIYGDDHITTSILALNHSMLLHASKKDPKLLKSVLKRFEKEYGPDAVEIIDVLLELGQAKASDFHTTGINSFKRALKISENIYGEQSTVAASVNLEIGKSLLGHSGSRKSIRYLKKAKAILEDLKKDENEVLLAETHFWIGKYQLAKRNNPNAVENLLNSLEVFEKYSPNASLTMSTHAFLIEAYERQGKRDEATKHCLAIGKAQPIKNDQDYMPVFRTQPVYPRGAIANNKEGHAIISMTIDTQGFVTNPEVIESKGGPQFIKASLEAIENFRYIPQFENGEPIKTEGVEYKFTFNLAD